MKEEFKSSFWKDFSQRYNGTYGWYEKPETKEKLLVILTAVSAERLNFQDKDGTAYFANPDVGNIFTFIPVERGVYDFKDTVVTVKRVPQRQWQRGICRQNTAIIDLATSKTYYPDFNNLEVVFKPSKPKDMMSQRVALNKSFAFVDDNVFLYDLNIGTINRNSGQVVLNTPLFKQEMEDIVNKNHLPLAVEVK